MIVQEQINPATPELLRRCYGEQAQPAEPGMVLAQWRVKDAGGNLADYDWIGFPEQLPAVKAKLL